MRRLLNPSIITVKIVQFRGVVCEGGIDEQGGNRPLVTDELVEFEK